MKKIILLAMFAVFLLSGCVTPTVPYQFDDLDIQPASSKEFILGVLDARPYVVDGQKNAGFTGIAGHATRTSVPTASGRPLADDIAISIQKSLAREGGKVTVIKLAAGTSQTHALAQLKMPSRKSVLIVLNDWRSMKIYNLALYYDVTASVYDDADNLVGIKTIKGTDIIEKGDIFRTVTVNYSAEKVPPFFRKKMEELLNAPEIMNALK